MILMIGRGRVGLGLGNRLFVSLAVGSGVRQVEGKMVLSSGG
jgi:hypothetical protein